MVLRSCLAGFLLLFPAYVAAQQTEKAISADISKLRSLSDQERASATMRLALDIRKLPNPSQLKLALSLASLATEGDFGRDTLQEVTTTLEQAVRATAPPDPSLADAELAQLARYEHMRVTLNDAPYAAALAKLEAEDKDRRAADFTLSDLNGTRWTPKDLQGKVVLVNFWATWCPPCRKEMPDLDALYARFKDQGLIILAISDEKPEVVKPFLADKIKVRYPVLLDPAGNTGARFHVDGIPKSFVYDRQGSLVAQSIDMRTMGQFLGMLQEAGLR